MGLFQTVSLCCSSSRTRPVIFGYHIWQGIRISPYHLSMLLAWGYRSRMFWGDHSWQRADDCLHYIIPADKEEGWRTSIDGCNSEKPLFRWRSSIYWIFEIVESTLSKQQAMGR
jgi:hypothetical protein